ncbi:hypothetical protein FD755_012913 [Muntiacus reevesi]|uniref:Small ribosomal subunit protein uS15 N-terminal domain-containing protein n=1 Tax=Muntiacus reevesi TaxID=9886 RepID=A0A5N3XSB5_MUNRE|nr:hypothetical protein FD755_012913 [Muntiacus reevesi]
MGPMHTPRKGLSQWTLPDNHSISTWLKLTSDNVKDRSKNGPRRACVILRDSHGATEVSFSKGLAPDLPEDLYHIHRWLNIIRPNESSFPIGNMSCLTLPWH